jgi:protein involved in ribonucleotide reduction
MKSIRRFLADETAATAIEYGLIAAGNTKFTSINSSLK